MLPGLSEKCNNALHNGVFLEAEIKKEINKISTAGQELQWGVFQEKG